MSEATIRRVSPKDDSTWMSVGIEHNEATVWRDFFMPADATNDEILARGQQEAAILRSTLGHQLPLSVPKTSE